MKRTSDKLGVSMDRETETTALSAKTSSVSSVSSVLSVHGDDARRLALVFKRTCTMAGRWRERLFQLVRAARGCRLDDDGPILGLDHEPTRQGMREIVREWVRQAKPVEGHGDAVHAVPFADVWGQFASCWDKVRYPLLTATPLAGVVERARATDAPPAVCGLGYDERTLLLAKLCRELQRDARAKGGDEPFFLSCRTVEEYLYLSRMSAWQKLRALQADGLLEIAEPGTTSKATRYRWKGEA